MDYIVNSMPALDGSQPPASPAPRDLISSSGLCKYCKHMITSKKKKAGGQRQIPLIPALRRLRQEKSSQQPWADNT